MLATKKEITKLYETLFKGGLENAAVFGVNSKSDFSNVSKYGKAFYSMEMLLKTCSKLSHFTPNVYKYNPKKTAQTGLYGFTERNLKQVNTFVVDIDNLKYSLQDILLACLDDSIGSPTMVIRTPNGYQVYFILSNPLSISSNKDYQSLKIAKRISSNLKTSLESVEADRYCNDFGFFRVPSLENIVWVNLLQTYTVEELEHWSDKFDDDLEHELYTPGFKISATHHLKTAAFQHMLRLTNIKGHQGKIGRNNTIFTIALACYADGISQFEAVKLLTKFNKNLKYPIKQTEFNASIRSAYSGRYSGPTKQYIEEIIGEQYTETFTKWHKFKKSRSERQYSHLNEWEDDIINYLETLEITDTPYIQLTQKQLCEVVGCQQSSLNALLKNSKRVIKLVIGKGRAAITKWSTSNLVTQHLLNKQTLINQKKTQYNQYLNDINQQNEVQYTWIQNEIITSVPINTS